jgi:predicted nucleic acid-binding protein
MAPNYKIEAVVFDIRNDKPQDNESFLVDTNVWLWLTYTRASIGPNPPYQVKHYSSYIQKCRAKNCRLLFCGLTLAELSHAIEKAEREIYNRANCVTIPTKEFRHNFPAERTNVISEVRSAWIQVKALGELLQVLIDQGETTDAEARYVGNPIDGYDLFMHGAMKKAGVSQILTDDGDFATVPGLHVFTSNQNVITSAQKQGKFKKR